MTEVLALTPDAATAWLPLGQAAAIFLSTFVLEDAATVGAGLLLATGSISWPAAFFACFLGIWLGDAGLYALARFAGRSWFEGSRFKKHSRQVIRSEAWFAERGGSILIFSRMIPGTRLPTYLAAGFLRMPAGRFLLITGVAALVWTLLVLLLARSLGSQLLRWLHASQTSVWLLVAGGLLFLITLQWIGRRLRILDWRRVTAWLERWRHWEFWPAWLFYPPVAIYGIWLAFKFRGAMLPTAANPGIASGGVVGESKMATLRGLMATSPEFTAEAELIVGKDPAERLASLREICQRRKIDYPYILKPDAGQRGAGIKLIRNETQALDYLMRISAAVIIQRYAAGPCEAGIFYYRFPGESRGHIFSITEKIFPTITGDGKSTVAELIWQDPRARLIAGKYLARAGSRKSEVLAAGQTFKLVEAGNHVQGCIFRDGAHFGSPELTRCIDAISQQVTGFNIGRYDLRYTSAQDLRAGKNFQIIELNGATAEATSIYDAKNSLWSAYRTLFQQWHLVFAIGAENRRRGCATTKPLVMWRLWRDYSALAATYPAAD